MERDETTTADDLDRPDGNSLLENYDLHDVGEEEFVRRVEDLGFEVEPWGIDMRHDGGEDGVIYDDKMDFKVTHDGDLCGIVDVKTKSGPRYMGMFNERHYVKYYEHSQDFDVPTAVVMFQVDPEGDIDDEFVFVIGGEMYDGVITSSRDESVSTFPDGNHAAVVEHDNRVGWNLLKDMLLIERDT